MPYPVAGTLREFAPPFTGPVFHYTSADGLLKILESKSLWASAAASLNDLAEVRQGWEMCEQALAALPKSDEADVLLGWAQDPVKGPHEVFVLSASEAGDDANQWRLYGDQGRGYALEIDSSIQLIAVSQVPEEAKTTSPAFGTQARNIAAVSPWRKVIYEEATAFGAIAALVDAVQAEARSIEAATDIGKDERDSAYMGLQDEAYEALATIAHLIKSEGFSGEREVRVVASFAWGQEHIRYRPSPIGIVGFATLAESPHRTGERVLRPPATGEALSTSLPVRSVRIGPLLRPEHEKTMLAFLRARDLREVQVETSNVPLR